VKAIHVCAGEPENPSLTAATIECYDGEVILFCKLKLTPHSFYPHSH